MAADLDNPMNVINWGLIGAGDIVRKRIAPALNDLATVIWRLLAARRAEWLRRLPLSLGLNAGMRIGAKCSPMR